MTRRDEYAVEGGATSAQERDGRLPGQEAVAAGENEAMFSGTSNRRERRDDLSDGGVCLEPVNWNAG